MGIISEVLPAFSKKPLFGYAIVVFSGAVIGFLGFAVWSHHVHHRPEQSSHRCFLATNDGYYGTQGKIFNWVGTLWGERVRCATDDFALGFVWMFVMGGFSECTPPRPRRPAAGRLFRHRPLPLCRHGRIFLAVVSGIYFWLPKMIGKMWKGNLNTVNILSTVGLNITFFPMHFLGLLGMPRRTHTYLAGFGWETYNLVCTIGAYILAFGIFLLVVDIIRCVRSGEPAGDDPGCTLEWATTLHLRCTRPHTRDPARDALWEHKLCPETRRIEYEADDGHGIHMPSNSWMPVIASLGFVPLRLGMSLMQAGVPFMGYTAIFGLIVIFCAIAL